MKYLNLTIGRHNLRRLVLIAAAVILVHSLSISAIALVAVIVCGGVALFRWTEEVRSPAPREPSDERPEAPSLRVLHEWHGSDFSPPRR